MSENGTRAQGSGPGTRLPSNELQWYALGSLPGGVGALSWSYLVFYYNQVLGLPGAAIGAAAFLLSVLDAVSDPLAGAISDRTRGSWGRRHPYLILAAIPTALSFYWLWSPPADLPVAALMAFLLVVHLVNRLASTFYSVPYLALGAEISRDHEERTRIVTMRGIWFHVGRAIAGAALLLIFLRPTEAYPNGQLNPEAYPRFAACFAVLMAAALFATAWKTRGWLARLSVAPAQRGIGLREMLRDFGEVLRYRSFRSLLLGSLSRHVAWGVGDSLGIYMATYFWGVSTDVLFLWGVGMFSGLFIGLPFWQRMASRYDKKPILIFGDASYLVFFCVPYLLKLVGFWPAEDSVFYVPLYILTTGFLSHFGIAASGATFGSMLGDVTDLDELERGRRREGVIFGAESFTWKALTGLSPLVAGIVVDLVGLSEEIAPDAASPDISFGLGLAQGLIATIFFTLAVIFVTRYDLSRARHAQVLAALDERRREPS